MARDSWKKRVRAPSMARAYSRGKPVKKTRSAMSQADIVAEAGINLFRRSPSTPLPLRLKTTMRYYDQKSMNIPAAGFYVEKNWRANGMYDPDVDVGGHQPRGFDQLALLYNHYCVVGSKITITIQSVDNTQPILAALILTESSTTFAMTDLMESSYCSYALIGPVNEPTKLVMTFSPKFFSQKNPLDEYNLAGTGTTDPAQPAYYKIGMNSPAGVDEADVITHVLIEYVAIWTEPKTPTIS